MKFTDGGHVHIAVRRDNATESIVWEVSDTGPGIPGQVIDEIFDTFYTTKRDGTGLGLSIARTIIDTYGGKIWAESEVGKGSSFSFSLPFTA